MKLVIQRVKRAKVSVSRKIIGQIEAGLFILVGFGECDDITQINAIAQKCVSLRIMSDSQDKMNLSIQDTKGEILVVSQFTLYADTSQGNRPSFMKAADPQKAKELYELFIEKLKESGLKVETGEFGSNMEIESAADGPVTITLDS